MRGLVAQIIKLQHVDHVVDIFLPIVVLVLLRIEFWLAIFLGNTKPQLGLFPICHFDGLYLFFRHVLLRVLDFSLPGDILFTDFFS